MGSYKYPHVAITVNNIIESKKFYEKIGFQVAENIYSQEKKRHFLLLQGFGLEIEVFLFDEQAPYQKYTTDIQTVGLQHIALPVSNIDEKKSELLQKEIALFKDITVSSLGVKNLNVVDPTGIIIEFFEINYV